MTIPETSQPEPDKRPQRQGVYQILGRSLKLYARHWKPLTLTLLWPLGQVWLGIYASQILPLFFMRWMAPHFAYFPVPILGGILLITLLCVALMLRGTWQYLVYWASLCLNAWQVEEGQPINTRAAYLSMVQDKKLPYSVLIGTYFTLPLIVFLPFLVMLTLSLMLGQPLQELLLLVGILQSAVLSLVWLFSLILFSFTFQVAAFENGIPVHPGPTFRLSAKLALKRFWDTLVLQLIVFLITNCLIPQPIVLLASLTRISQPLDWLHLWILQETLGHSAQDLLTTSPLLAALLNPNGALFPELARALTAISIGSVVTMLLLPFGTLVFTLLYKNILRYDRSKKTILGI